MLGAVRDPVADAARLVPALAHKVTLHTWDMEDIEAMAGVLAAHRPHAVFNLAARSSGAGMFLDPAAQADVNGLAVLRLLEAIRLTDPAIRFCQASSSEMFGDAENSPQSEMTAFRPRSPYGAAKLFAHNMVGIYRRHHGLFACSAILFNHESPRRGPGFVTQKIASGAARIKQGMQSELRLGNLDARRDWGSAPDFTRAMRLMVESPHADDYVIATGNTHSVRDFCKLAFAHINLDYREFVREDASAFRAAEAVPLVGDASKATRVLGWKPEVSFETVVRQMVDAEVDKLRQMAT